jgi:hypothetical protein
VAAAAGNPARVPHLAAGTDLLRRTRHGLPPGTPLARYAGGLARLYRGICQVTGADVIVDSSKEPTDAALLLRMPEVHASFVQIVRDPRGTAYSIVRLRSGDRPPAVSRWRDSAYAALSWSAGNNNRFRTGQITLREDTEWRQRLTRLDRAAVTAVSLPLMAHYGYRLLGTPRSLPA